MARTFKLATVALLASTAMSASFAAGPDRNDQAPFVIDPALVAVVNDYSRINAEQRGYIADMLVPNVRVDGPLFEYPEYKVEDAFTVYDNTVDRLGRLNEITESAEMASGAVKDYGIAQPVPFRDEAAAARASIPFNLKTRAARNVTNQNQLNREIRVAALLQSTGSYQAGYFEDEVGAPWTGAVDIPSIVETARDNMLLPANVAWMSRAVYRTIRRHDSMSEALGGTYSKGKALNEEQVAEALGVDRIVIGNTLKQTSKRGQTLTTGAIWGDHFGLLHVPQAEADGMVNDSSIPAFALTFVWGDEVSGEIPDPNMGLYGGVRVRSGKSLVEKVVAPFGGYLFQNVLG